MGGDINAKRLEWGCHCISTAGDILYQYVESHHSISILPPTRPTFIYRNTPYEILDFIIHSNSILPTTPRPLFELRSDHLPILIAIYLGAFPTLSKNPTKRPQIGQNLETELPTKLNCKNLDLAHLWK